MPSTIQNMLENSAWIGLMYLLVTSLRKKKTIKIFEISQAHLLQVVSVLEGSVLNLVGGRLLGVTSVWFECKLWIISMRNLSVSLCDSLKVFQGSVNLFIISMKFHSLVVLSFKHPYKSTRARLLMSLCVFRLSMCRAAVQVLKPTVNTQGSWQQREG